jgi:serine/threonine protein kinase
MAELFFATVKGADDVEHACVIKRVLPHLSSDARLIAMFLNEARVAARLDHPGIARIHDLGREGAHYYIVLEYLAGEDCAELIAAARGQGAPVSVAAACTIVCRAAEALHFAHELRGPDGACLELVHRDVSASNLFVTYEGDVKLLDFGIALSSHRLRQLHGGEAKGKSGYLAPEVLEGGVVDRRSDVWALGVCLYELLTAEAQVDVLRGHVAPPSTLRTELSAELDAIVLDAIALDPRQRLATAAVLAARLQPFLPASPRAVLANQMRQLFGDGRRRTVPSLERAPEVRVGTEPLGVDTARSDVDAATQKSAEPFRAWTADDESQRATEPDAGAPASRRAGLLARVVSTARRIFKS